MFRKELLFDVYVAHFTIFFLISAPFLVLLCIIATGSNSLLGFHLKDKQTASSIGRARNFLLTSSFFFVYFPEIPVQNFLVIRVVTHKPFHQLQFARLERGKNFYNPAKCFHYKLSSVKGHYTLRPSLREGSKSRIEARNDCLVYLNHRLWNLKLSTLIFYKNNK